MRISLERAYQEGIGRKKSNQCKDEIYEIETMEKRLRSR